MRLRTSFPDSLLFFGVERIWRPNLKPYLTTYCYLKQFIIFFIWITQKGFWVALCHAEKIHVDNDSNRTHDTSHKGTFMLIQIKQTTFFLLQNRESMVYLWHLTQGHLCCQHQPLYSEKKKRKRMTIFIINVAS